MTVDVGILAAPSVDYTLHGPFEARRERGGVSVFVPQDAESFFELAGVTIGVGFHWERREPQRFRGELRLTPDGNGNTVAVNRIDVEEYLKSVISSEMSAQAPIEFLKAHAILSRSWLAHILTAPVKGIKDFNHFTLPGRERISPLNRPEMLVRWYDRDDHRGFDVCADDHCQRYQGIGRISNPRAAEAVEATRGMVLTYGGEVCDARFSKCCGGRTELYSNCWDDRDVPYLQSVADPYCDTHDAGLLATVLNDYDRETPDFHDWSVTMTDEELSRLVSEKTGRDLGRIVSLIPLRRGASGRIVLLEIVGEKGRLTVGKELEIRRVLSPTHLKSSDFTVRRLDGGGWRLDGHGWGHGVGLCQIGAAAMASEGFNAREILAHYFPSATLQRIVNNE